MQLLPVRSNLQVNGTNTSLIHSSINCGHVTISAQHFLMIILSPTLCVIITPALLVMYLPSGEMIEIIYTDLLIQSAGQSFIGRLTFYTRVS